MKKFTAQDIIDMGAELYDDHGFTRANIWLWLKALADNGCMAAEYNLDRLFDLIIG